MGVVGGEELQGWEKTSEAGGERILVSVRLRPLNAKESARNDVSEWECINDNTIIFKNSLQDRSLVPTAYSYDRVFQCKCSTKQVYEEAAKEVALSVISGINSSIFAYGQTSSGKTYTMTGITEYTIADIYDYIQKHEERVFILKFSAMEIYNEAVRDLLSADGTPLRLLDDPERGTIVERLTEETLRDWNHLQELLAVCEAQRQIGETNLNETSSRSHQILRLTIESSAREFFSKESSSTLAASVNFVDLAGSERASQALSAGTRLKEGCHINRSLLTLGTVIRKLSKGRGAHIPYRDSKLTRILQSSLGGNSRTAIICTMSPARSHTEQSRNTLLFATCAKDVATNAQVNVVMSDKALVRHLQRELARMEGELSGMGPTISASHSELLVREKDIQIQKMEKEIKELIQQRDLAQSRLEDLLRVVGDDQASRLWAEFNHPPASHASNACEDELSVSGSSGVADRSLDFGLSKFMASQYSKEYSDAECNEDYLQLAEIPEDQMLFDGISPRISNSSPKSVGSIPHQGGEEISQETNDDVEDQCKEVRCIETEELNTNRKEEPNNVSLPEGNEMSPPLTLCDNTCVKDQESESTERAIELQPVGTDSTYGALEKQLHDVQKMIDGLVRPSDESSPWPSTVDLSSSRSSYLSRSRSCRAALMTSSNSPLFQEAEQNENTPPGGFEKDFPGRPAAGDFQRRSCALNFETEALSRECSQSSEQSASIDVLKSQNIKATTEENITSIRSFVAGLKEMAQLQYQKKLVDGQVKMRHFEVLVSSFYENSIYVSQ
ncbi:kinesin-like protein KIN-7F isoform X2 [Magnolia sinica]|uniref:kinesin-like protein KIN-7F isoform X2 n=1 Tax=Magnolia sinica TaxID=86752 RepID=UPI002659C2F0|nr:kinesin-like protein KIN-7F isoform X2 [Magnolia sinica]